MNFGQLFKEISPEEMEIIKNYLKDDLFKDLDIEKISIQIIATNKK